eukprot:1136987-Pelagomonas_calceolata.AAC.3
MNFLYLRNLVQSSCSNSLTGGHGHTMMVAVISRMANKKFEQVFTALLLTAKTLLSPPVLELPTPYVEPLSLGHSTQ